MTRGFANRDIISANDLSKDEILHILECSQKLKKKPSGSLLDGYVLASCFFEPSTRTRLSFEAAMQRLGGSVIGFSDSTNTSSRKGESLHDSMKIIGYYADLIVIRHPLEGAARIAAEATEKPVINAGDGSNQHPTQTLLDLFSIQECQKKLDGLHIAMVGDLKYGRTVHSLAQACIHFNIRLYFVAPESLAMPDFICDELRKKGLKFSFHKTIEEVIDQVDVLYMTRLQEERFSDKMLYERMKGIFTLTPNCFKKVKKNLRILHPLPRVQEISQEVDKTPYAYYFEQAQNGLYVRQALLGLLLGKIK